MNLLLLSHRVPYPANKGEKIRTFNQLSQLVNKGHKVTVVTPVEDEQSRTYVQQLSERLKIKVVHAPLGNRLLRILGGFTSRQALTVTNFYSEDLQQQINSLIIAEKPDAIMCSSSAMSRYIFQSSTAALIEEQNIRLVMDFMDLDSLKWQQYAELKPWPLSLVYKREAKLVSELESRVLHHFDSSMFVSKEEKDLLELEPEIMSKVHAIANGVDRGAYHPAEVEDTATTNTAKQKLFGDAAPVVLFTGVMDYFPNIEAVVWFADEVWPALLQKHPQAKFVVAGMRPSRKITDLEKRSRIEVTGFVDDILPLYQQADFMVAPFKVGRGIQNKVIQSMACGLPVIASPAGAAGIKYVNMEHLIIAETTEDYLSATETLLNDTDRYQKIRSNALELIESQFSWESETARLEKLLNGNPI